MTDSELRKKAVAHLQRDGAMPLSTLCHRLDRMSAEALMDALAEDPLSRFGWVTAPELRGYRISLIGINLPKPVAVK